MTTTTCKRKVRPIRTSEIAIVREKYPVGGTALCRQFMDRSAQSIRNIAYRIGVTSALRLATFKRPAKTRIKIVDAELFDLYVIKAKSSVEIGAALGVNPATVCKWLRKRGIAARTPAEGSKLFAAQRRSSTQPKEPRKERSSFRFGAINLRRTSP